MSNDWFVASGSPATKSHGSSAVMRSEFGLIEQLAEKLPPLTDRGGHVVFVVDGGTALESVSAASARQKLGLEIGKDVQSHSTVLDNTTASFTTALKDGYDNTKQKFEVDHSATTGKHNKVTLPQLASDPSVGSNEFALYAKNFDGQTEAFLKNGAGSVIRLTAKGEFSLDLKNTDVVVGSIRTQSYSRGKVVTVIPETGAAPSGRDLVQIDWEAGTVFRVTLVADSDLEFVNMPDTSVDEEQTIYVDMQDGGNFFIGLISDYTLLWPAGRAGTEELTTDGRDLFLATTDDGTSVMVVPMLDMSESS